MQLKMVRSITPIWLLTKVALILLCSQHVTALYFLIDGTTEKCFYEDLPKDTIVVGKSFQVRTHLHNLGIIVLAVAHAMYFVKFTAFNLNHEISKAAY